MRAIEFRGKTENLGKWVYGNLLGDSTIIPRGQIFEVDEGYIDDQLKAYSVLPETIGQYTGLEDKNGKKIFEGDILLDFDEEIGCVEFDECAFWENIDNITYSLSEFLPRDIEVIGNIYDNPEY